VVDNLGQADDATKRLAAVMLLVADEIDPLAGAVERWPDKPESGLTRLVLVTSGYATSRRGLLGGRSRQRNGPTRR
jgi:hypothetical protein